MKKLLLLILGLLLFTACSNDIEENGDRTNASMTQDEAYEIALDSPCTEQGEVFNDAYYNDYTKTWWFETDIEKANCSPECMVSEETREAEVNWLCLGLEEE